MKILITGAQGFIGRNLVAQLKNEGYDDIDTFTVENSMTELVEKLKKTEFIFHLAGVNRPKEDQEFFEGNSNLTEFILQKLEEYNPVPIVISSSIQAELNNSYGKSKKISEDLVFEYGRKNKVDVMVYRFPNVFGKWSQPNYNSVIATFCHNIALDKPIKIDNAETLLNLVYIDDVVKELILCLKGEQLSDGNFCKVPVVYTQKLGWIAEKLKSFRESREKRTVPNVGDDLSKKLYSTYLSFLQEDDFAYELKMNKDERGSFTEFLKTDVCGQVSINISKKGIAKGNHWHHTKNEKFLVVSGTGVVKFRKIDTEKVIEYPVNGKNLVVVDIPVGYTHSIENLGEEDLVTVMWANESFDPENPDTYYLEV